MKNISARLVNIRSTRMSFQHLRMSFQRKLESKGYTVKIDSSFRWNDKFRVTEYLPRLIILVLLSLCCSGCFWKWHLRNPDETPPQLRVMYLHTEGVDSHFKVQLWNLLQSMKITQVKKRQAASYTLHVFDYSLEHDNPPVSSTNVGITYTYTLTVTVSIENAAGVVIVPAHTITTTRDVTVNVNQIFTINSTSVFQQELQREAINLIYYWLTSDQTRALLIHPGMTHAIESVTTSPAS